MSSFHKTRCEHKEITYAYALEILPTSEVAAAEAHVARARIASASWKVCAQ